MLSRLPLTFLTSVSGAGSICESPDGNQPARLPRCSLRQPPFLGLRPIDAARGVFSLLLCAGLTALAARADTVALWLFDEQEQLYPSSILNDAGPNNWFLVLGRGGEIVPGKFGRALRPVTPPPFNPVTRGRAVQEEFTDAGNYSFGLESPPMKPGRTVAPMTWMNATFAAAFVNGDEHLRRAPFAHPTPSSLNLGRGDFTVEFWFKADSTADPTAGGVVFELGSGPRGENEVVTRLSLHAGAGEFQFVNQPSGTAARLKTNVERLGRDWTHCAFVYEAARGELRHYLNGALQSQAAASLLPLPEGEEDYFSVGRDGVWGRPLAGSLDELRVSDVALYQAPFSAPGSFSRHTGRPPKPLVLQPGPPLQFPGGRMTFPVVDLAQHKHLFIDDALLAHRDNVSFSAHPVRIEETVLPHATGWTTVIEGSDGVIRLYGESKDGVAVWTSRDGVNFIAPDLGHGRGNEILPAPARRGSVFIDPNAPPGERWKMLVGLHERGGIFIYTSPDGWNFKRNEVAAVPFFAGSASTIYYDDQRQLYVAHHRTDYGRTPADKTYRFALRSEVKDIMGPWPLNPITEQRKAEFRRIMRLADTNLDPWWLDNGPLAPGGFSIEYPIALGPDPVLDPEATDLYNTRAIKYPWAPDTYVAFPLWFFHYNGDGPPTRVKLSDPALKRGTGLVECQLAVSRDGVTWKRYPRPAYLPVGTVKGFPMRRPYIAFGLVRRGAEIWQYSFTRSSYHSGGDKSPKPYPPAVVHRLSQRLDGFVSLDAPYEKEGMFTTHPLRFSGNELVVNIDAGATGYAQFGFEDEQGRPVPGLSVDDCVWVNGNEVAYRVMWLTQGGGIRTRLDELANRPVRLVARLRGASLYAIQFPSAAP